MCSRDAYCGTSRAVHRLTLRHADSPTGWFSGVRSAGGSGKCTETHIRPACSAGAGVGPLCLSARAYDALIAATALANDLPLYTCNPDDFAIDGLIVVSVPLAETAPEGPTVPPPPEDVSRDKP